MSNTRKLKLKSDIMFKAFFSKSGNEKYLGEFLSSILNDNVTIKHVVHDARLEQLSSKSKYGVLDLDVKLSDGRLINVEMQIKNYHNIEQRTTFYMGKKISEQLSVSQDFNKLKPVIIVVILDYSFLNVPEYFNETVRVLKNHRDYEVNNNVKYIYIELDKFRKSNPNIENPLDQWLLFVDGERKEFIDMVKEKNATIKEASQSYEYLTGEAEAKRLADIELFNALEENSAKLYYKETGLAEGRAIGIKLGRKEGRIKGRAEGRAEGKSNAIKSIAKKMLKENLSLDVILKITGLTEKEILQLK